MMTKVPSPAREYPMIQQQPRKLHWTESTENQSTLLVFLAF